MIADLALAWRLARRELRGSVRRFGVFMACLAVGVGAIATVGNVNASVVDAIKRDARALLGGDVMVEAGNMPLAEDELAALVPPGAALARTVRTNAMAEGRDGRRLAVSLKGVGDTYPLFGSLQLDPPVPLEEALGADGAVVEAGLLARLGVAVGDTIKLGEAQARITAVIVREPDRVGGFVGLGPRVIVGERLLPATNVLLPGAIATYTYAMAVPPGVVANDWAMQLRSDNPEARWQVRVSDDVQPQIARFTDRLATYLTLAGLAALLTGGLGVALAVSGYLAGKTTTIATFKCLGAPARLVFAVYLMQVLALAAIGTAIGLVVGQVLPLLVMLLPASAMPVDIGYGFHPVPLAIAAGCGMLVAIAFALWPLAMAQEVAPASLFRSLVSPLRRLPKAGYLALMAACLAALAGLAIASVARPELGAAFVGVAVGAAILLAVLARLILAGVRLIGRSGPMVVRLALANLHRPGSGAVSVVAALGAGIAVLTMIAMLRDNLAREIDTQLPARSPGLFFIDIQPAQKDAFLDAIAAAPEAHVEQIVPVLRARVVRINGAQAESAKVGERVRWTLDRDRGLTYAASPPDGTELVAGAWWPADYAGEPLVSVEDEVAVGYGVGIGDKLAFNVLGRIVEARIASLRKEIDWGRGRLDFVFILSPGALDAAPHTLVSSVSAPPAGVPAIMDRMAQLLPNVTPIAIADIVAQVGDVLRKIALAVTVVALVSLASGLLVLAGAVAAARRRHHYEAAVLKVVGATRRDILGVFAIEYAGLGIAAAVAGLAIGTFGAWLVVRWLMELQWHFETTTALMLGLTSVAVTLIAGGLGTWRLLGRTAASVLRET